MSAHRYVIVTSRTGSYRHLGVDEGDGFVATGCGHVYDRRDVTVEAVGGVDFGCLRCQRSAMREHAVEAGVQL